MGREWLLLVSLLGLFDYGSSIRCFECQDMPTPHSCDTVVDCVDGDYCSLEQIVTSSGYILYNQGCKSRLKCNTVSRRSSGINRALTDVPTCDECCPDDYCNLAGCGQIAPPRNTRGPYCFQCDAQAEEDHCRTVKTCEIDETCVVMNTTNNFAANGEMSYQAGCIYISQCHALQSIHHPHVISGTGVIDHCPMCCRDDFCNDNCNHNVTMATAAPAVDGQWSLWAQWSTCSVTCGSGEHTRTRLCNNPAPENNGRTCSGDNLDISSCAMGTCPPAIAPPVNGQWSTWTQWGSCSVTCDQGTATRGRLCASPAPLHGGQPCAGASIETLVCDTHHPCSAPSINGHWTTWTQWGSCSGTCGQGTATRGRICANPPPQNGGHPCAGAATETQGCDTHNHCPVNGYWRHWSSWSLCSATCGTGSQARTRVCHQPHHGGQPCVGSATDVRDCHESTCSVVTCANHFNYYPGIGCYHIALHPTEYPTAEYSCAEQNRAHVLTIHNSTTYQQVINLLTVSSLNTNGVWLGIHWDSEKHVWVWNNGQNPHTSDFESFSSTGFPHGTSAKSCVLLNVHGWYTSSCDALHPYICVI